MSEANGILARLSATPIGSRIAGLIAQGKDAAQGDSLRSKIFANVGWLAVVFGTEVFVRLISSMILTRLLDPGAYGLISTVMVVMVFVTMLSDLGIKTMVLADERGEEKKFLGTLWTMQVMRGFIIAIIVCGLSLVWMHALDQHWIPATSNYADPMLPKLAMVISVLLITMGFSSLNEYRLIRHLERAAIAKVDIASRVLSALITIGLALIFRSVWAIALGLVLSNLARTILTHLYLAGPRMALTFDWREIGRVMGLSRWVALNSLMTCMTAQADKVLIGYGFGMEVLGVYAIAFSLYAGAATVVDQLNGALGVPVIRKLLEKPPADCRRDYYRFRLPIDIYCAVTGTGMALFGVLFFKLAYDPRYETGGMFLALLGIKIVLMPMHLGANFLLAQLRYKLTSFIGMLRGVTFLTAMGVAVWMQDIHLMVVVIAVEQLPEIMAYFGLRRTGIPFALKRDGALLALAALLGVYLLAL